MYCLGCSDLAGRNHIEDMQNENDELKRPPRMAFFRLPWPGRTTPSERCTSQSKYFRDFVDSHKLARACIVRHGRTRGQISAH